MIFARQNGVVSVNPPDFLVGAESVFFTLLRRALYGQRSRGVCFQCSRFRTRRCRASATKDTRESSICQSEILKFTRMR